MSDISHGFMQHQPKGEHRLDLVSPQVHYVADDQLSLYVGSPTTGVVGPVPEPVACLPMDSEPLNWQPLWPQWERMCFVPE